MIEGKQARAEAIELIYSAYKDCLDLDVAFTVSGIEEEDRIILEQDKVLLARTAVWDARVKQDLIIRLRTMITDAQSEAVRLQALKELGKTFYSKRFKDSPVLDDSALIHLGVPAFVQPKEEAKNED